MTRDVNRAIERVERAMARALDELGAKPPKKEAPRTRSPTIRAWQASEFSPVFDRGGTVAE